MIFVKSLQDDTKDDNISRRQLAPLLERISILDIYPEFQPEFVVDSFDELSGMEIRSKNGASCRHCGEQKKYELKPNETFSPRRENTNNWNKKRLEK